MARILDSFSTLFPTTTRFLHLLAHPLKMWEAKSTKGLKPVKPCTLLGYLQ